MLFSRRRAVSAGCAAGLACVVPLARLARAGRETFVERSDLSVVFEDAGVSGAFVLFDGRRDTFTVVGGERALQRYVPASTFKITNSLIALESGAVADQNEVIPYGGKPQPFKAWERDMSLLEAVPASNVPVFQEIARRVGLDRYRLWLDKLDYGNGETGQVVDRFWLDGPLAISAVEQAVFLDRLARRELPMSRRSQDVVASLVRLEERDGRTLHAKTGWLTSVQPNIGWWVGWVERPDGEHRAFALNIDMSALAEAPKRIEIGRAILGRLGILPL